LVTGRIIDPDQSFGGSRLRVLKRGPLGDTDRQSVKGEGACDDG